MADPIVTQQVSVPVNPDSNAQPNSAADGGIPTSKPSYLSKTLWGNVIMAILTLAVPGTADWFKSHPEYIVYLFVAINFILRKLTKDKLELW